MLTEFFICAFIILFAMFWPRLIGGAEWEPASMRVVRKMLSMAKTSKKDIVYDLGCGDGRFVVSAIKDFHAKKAIGIEIDPLRVLFSKLRTIGMKNAKIIFGSITKKDFSDASVVTCFLRANTNSSIQDRLSKLKKGTRIVSYIWKFSGWKPVAVDEKEKISLYIIGKT